VFCLLGLFSLEWILFSYQVEYATTKTPDVDFFREELLLKNQLRSRIVDMAREVIPLEKLLKVEWHSNRVELDMFHSCLTIPE
jgi:hypothetical protein